MLNKILFKPEAKHSLMAPWGDNNELKRPGNKAGAIGMVSEKYERMMIRYAPLQTWKASQPPQAISLAVMNRIANEIEGCKTDLRFSRHF